MRKKQIYRSTAIPRLIRRVKSSIRGKTVPVRAVFFTTETPFDKLTAGGEKRLVHHSSQSDGGRRTLSLGKTLLLAYSALTPGVLTPGVLMAKCSDTKER